MISALLADQYGMLDDAGLDCRTCEGALRAGRGCGVSPMYETQDGTEAWSLVDYLERCEQEDIDPIDEVIIGQHPYRLADAVLGSEMGELWPHCPRFYAAFASRGARREAIRIISLVRAAEDPILVRLHTAPMSPREVALYVHAKRFDLKALKASRDAKAPAQAGASVPEFEVDITSPLSPREQEAAFVLAQQKRGRR